MHRLLVKFHCPPVIWQLPNPASHSCDPNRNFGIVKSFDVAKWADMYESSIKIKLAIWLIGSFNNTILSSKFRAQPSPVYYPPPPPPDHLLFDRSSNIGPLISCWELDKFKNCWNKSFRASKILTLLYQHFSNLLISQLDMSGPRLGALSNNMSSWSIYPGLALPKPNLLDHMFEYGVPNLCVWCLMCPVLII